MLSIVLYLEEIRIYLKFYWKQITFFLIILSVPHPHVPTILRLLLGLLKYVNTPKGKIPDSEPKSKIFKRLN